MQRQDDFLITQTAMLLFIMQLNSLAGLAFQIAAQSRQVDDLLLRSFLRSEHVMLIVLSGIVSNTNTRRALPGLDEFDAPDSIDRHAELIRLAATFQQIAMALAMILAMNPRAFRDRMRQSQSSLWGRHSLSSFRGREAEPGIQRWDRDGLALASMTAAQRSTLHHSISGFRVRLCRPGMTPYLAPRGPP